VGTVIFGLLAVGIGWLLLYFLIQSAVRDGVGKALRDHDGWRRENRL
jgi:hypothetical protein